MRAILIALALLCASPAEARHVEHGHNSGHIYHHGNNYPRHMDVVKLYAQFLSWRAKQELFQEFYEWRFGNVLASQPECVLCARTSRVGYGAGAASNAQARSSHRTRHHYAKPHLRGNDYAFG